MEIRDFEKIEDIVLKRASKKSSTVKETLEFIVSRGYTDTEAEEILKRIYIRHSPPDGVLY